MPNARTIGNVGLGMQALVRGELEEGDPRMQLQEVLLHQYAEQVGRVKEPLEGQHTGNSMYGLKGLSNSRGSEAVLHAIAPHIDNAERGVTGQSIGNALWGLLGMHDSDGVRVVMPAIARQLALLEPGSLSSQHIANGLRGIAMIVRTQEEQDGLMDDATATVVGRLLDAAGSTELSRAAAVQIAQFMSITKRWPAVP